MSKYLSSWKLSTDKILSLETNDCLSLAISGNVLQIDVGGLTKLTVSIPTKGYLKIQMFISEGK